MMDRKEMNPRITTFVLSVAYCTAFFQVGRIFQPRMDFSYSLVGSALKPT